MTQHWQQLVSKIDALSVRERIVIFAMSALLLIVLANNFLLAPQFAKQALLSDQVKQEQSQIASLQAEIQQKLALQQIDPDMASRAHLQVLTQQTSQMRTALGQMEKGLVSPDKVPALLEDLVRQNGKVHLLSLKTLPAMRVSGNSQTENNNDREKPAEVFSPSKESQDGNAAAGAVYRHGVEIVVQGSYLDILDYLTQLEAMSWQPVWGKAKLNVDAYPKSTLTLALFTLSLDRKWLNL